MRYPILISLLYFFLFNQTSLIIQSWLSTISIFQTLVIYHHSQKIIYIYIYMSRFRHFERKEKEWEKEICIYLILFPKSSKQSSKHNVHFTRLEGWKEELARRLSLHLPSLLSRKTTILASSCRFPSPWPQEPLKKNRWRSISSTNGIARNHLRRQPNLEAPVGRRDPRSFPPSRMGVLETPIHPCYIDLHPCAVSGVESTNDTVVTFVWQRGLWSRPRISRG